MHLQLALAEVVFFIGSSLYMVSHDEWKNTWHKIAEYGPGFFPLSYPQMRNLVFDKCYANVKQGVETLILNHIGSSRCTIISDGWSDATMSIDKHHDGLSSW
ncbi:hypothetical protein O6H91_15G026800 [Diphasiastrum complanatum]|uniref:Uncharacterized protein n=1 Tax=Diphasiastrum complanatum TaxID=34168 RepID=A0ACC2BGX0_DIPCM|nr:hypothetical protein O6H91_15G026800 [Diphasiastrum complanatum]